MRGLTDKINESAVLNAVDIEDAEGVDASAAGTAPVLSVVTSRAALAALQEAADRTICVTAGIG